LQGIPAAFGRKVIVVKVVIGVIVPAFVAIPNCP
jgi:hypothetical protein